MLTLLFGKEVSKKTCETETHGSDDAVRGFQCGFGCQPSPLPTVSTHAETAKRRFGPPTLTAVGFAGPWAVVVRQPRIIQTHFKGFQEVAHHDVRFSAAIAPLSIK